MHFVVQVVGDYGFEFCSEQLAVACMYDIPILSVIVNNGYLSLIRQAEKYGYQMNYEVSIWYQGENKMVDFVKFADAFGAHGERVEKPEDIKKAFGRALEWMKTTKKPALVDIVVERETDASMGASIDVVREFEEEVEAEKKREKRRQTERPTPRARRIMMLNKERVEGRSGMEEEFYKGGEYGPAV